MPIRYASGKKGHGKAGRKHKFFLKFSVTVDMGNYFHRFLAILLLAFVGLGFLGSGEVHASGGSFDVPQVNDHFDQFEKGPAPKKTETLTQNTKEEGGTWDWITKPVSGVWEWTKEKVSSAWEWTKETASSFWNWFVEILAKITEVVVNALSAALDWIVKYKEYVAFAGVLILGVVLCFVAPPLGAAVLSGMALSFIISTALNGWKIDKTTFLEAAIGGLLGLIGEGIAGGVSRGLASGLGQKLMTGVAGSRVLGPIVRGGGKLISKLPKPVQQIFSKAGVVGAVEGAGTSVVDDLLHGRKINWKMALLSGVFGAGMVGVVTFAKPVIDKATASLTPILAKTPIVKNIFKNADDCFAYYRTPGYFALATSPIKFKCANGLNLVNHNSNDTDFSYDKSKVKEDLNPEMGKVREITKTYKGGPKKGQTEVVKRKVINWKGEEKTLINGTKDKFEVTLSNGDKVDVPFKNGFPDFSKWSAIELKLPEEYWFKSDSVQFRYLAKEVYKRTLSDAKLREQFTPTELELLKEGKLLPRFTWHHHQDPGKMQLVLTEIHAPVKHTGGREIWGGGDEGRSGKLDPS